MEKVVIGKATLYLGDCMEGMKEMPDKAFDLAIVDPPYGISQPAFRRESNNKAAITKDYHNAVYSQSPPDKLYFDELTRVSRHQIIWGANYYNHLLPCGRQWIFWDKGTEKTQWGDGELAYTSFIGAIRKYQFDWNGMIQGNMKDKELRIHPTQKPVAIYKMILRDYAKEGHSILDTHHGSGSNAIACLDRGHEITAFEIDPDYFYPACERIERAQQQLKLF